MNIKYALLARSLLVMMLLVSSASQAENQGARLKDIASVKGVRENILIGYGIVVGLKGTGDSSADVTARSLGKLFSKLGLEVGKNEKINSKNACLLYTSD